MTQIHRCVVASTPDHLVPRCINIWILFGIRRFRHSHIDTRVSTLTVKSVGTKFCYENQNSCMFINFKFIIKEAPTIPFILARSYRASKLCDSIVLT